MIEGFSELFDAADAESGQQRTSSWTTGSAYEGQYDTELYRDFATDAVKRHAALMASSSSGSDSETPLFMWCAQHGIHAEYDSDPIPPDSMLSASNKKYLKTLDMRMRDTVTSDDDDDDDDGGSSSESGPGSGSLPGADSGKDEEERFFKMRKIPASVLMSIDNSLKHLVQTLDEVVETAGRARFGGGHPEEESAVPPLPGMEREMEREILVGRRTGPEVAMPAPQGGGTTTGTGAPQGDRQEGTRGGGLGGLLNGDDDDDEGEKGEDGGTGGAGPAGEDQGPPPPAPRSVTLKGILGEVWCNITLF